MAVLGEVVVVVDECDHMKVMRAALASHQPAQGRIVVQPTPASSRPAALAHDVLYALGKRLAPAPGAADVWLDSVTPAWLAAAAWSTATGVRHVVVTRAHLLTARRIDQLLAWRETTGVQLTLLWQASPRRLPPALIGARRCVSTPGVLEAILHTAGPLPAQPSFPPTAAAPATDPAVAQPQSILQAQLAWPATAAAIPARTCTGASASAQRQPPAHAHTVAPTDVAALARIAHPLITGALSVLAFTGTQPGALRWLRDLDITPDIDTLKTHAPNHLGCRLHALPTWARPLLAAARTHHRLSGHQPEEALFTAVLTSGARHLRAHAARLPTLNLAMPPRVLVA
ncbi:hypothetical protein [Streptomyces montanisoli]|uniref:Uncharacterized protein n=1 Tax=Streptomyces montanisoli TaxID=2798581 RepID=A0A940RW22_9ACTN|nr:hypothetical protein [Streptomyces montanisoli]MBP0458980.1 hypothetical protein [Streptomyces montanisoli]